MESVRFKKKLIEVALPLEAINVESVHRKQKAPKGFPTIFHKWFAQRPLAACRAVIFASLVDDPSARLDKFPTEMEQDIERERLLDFIKELLKWDNSRDQRILDAAVAEIRNSTGGQPPPIRDPFCGSGSIPLEAQRLGLESYASDLNPVAVLITKALIEIPRRFEGREPVNAVSRNNATLLAKTWRDSEGLAEDVIYYGQWVVDEAQKRIGRLYPKIVVTDDMAAGRADLKGLVGRELTVTTWLWARTVKSPNPAFSHVDVPLASTFVLSNKPGKDAYIEPVVERDGYTFAVRVGKAKDPTVLQGTKLARGSNFRCLMSGSPISSEYIKNEGTAQRIGTRMMAIVAESQRGRIYLPPTPLAESAARSAQPVWQPDLEISGSSQYVGVKPYGIERFSQFFTDRQLVALTTFADVIQEARTLVRRDAIAAGMSDDGRGFEASGTGAAAYSDAITTYLACALDRMVNYGSSVTTWRPKDNALAQSMVRQAFAMVWDFAESNPFGKSSGDFVSCVNSVANYLAIAMPRADTFVNQCDARSLDDDGKLFMFSTDPPYYDNVPYADLSDFFYVWLRRSLKDVFPQLFATLATPKVEELVAFAHRHEGKAGAEAFFLDGMTDVMRRLAEQADPEFPITIYYAFKQSETDGDEGTTSTGWETFLDAVIRAGFAVNGTWPLRTESPRRIRAMDSNALASSIVLVCRPRGVDAPISTRREFLNVLKMELPIAVTHLQRGNIAPVDLAQAAIGPGMAVFTRFAKVLNAAGDQISVREALAAINETLDEVLAKQEGDFDADSRWAVAWFDQFGFADGEYGIAEALSKAKNTSVGGLASAGILTSRGGKVRLYRPSELLGTWDPTTDSRLTVWEMVHHLIRVLEADGENAASQLLAKAGSRAEAARELAYRLYSVCERKKRAREALSYNGLVQSWPEIDRLSRDTTAAMPTQTDLLGAF